MLFECAKCSCSKLNFKKLQTSELVSKRPLSFKLLTGTVSLYFFRFVLVNALVI